MGTQSLPVLTNEVARRLFLHMHGLIERPVGPERASDISEKVTELGFVQVDSINTVARAHDHILWSRMPRYNQGRAMRLAARQRSLFEGWTHDAAIIPSHFFPIWRHKFEADRVALGARWESWGREGFTDEFDKILHRIAKDGALNASEIGDGQTQNGGGWWDWKPTKTALEFLWRAGELGICHRKGFQKSYDLIERIIPPEHLNARVSTEEALDWAARAALDRLGFATPSELSAFWDIFPKPALADWANPTPDGLGWVEVEGADGSKRPALTHADIDARIAALPEPTQRLRILNPFDPALRDRIRAQRLFGFEYRIEVFVPEAKRRYGYYVYPILEGTKLTGRIDVKADRASGRLRIFGFWLEPGVKLGSGRSARLADELHRLAGLAEVGEIEIVERPQTALLKESAAFKAALG